MDTAQRDVEELPFYTPDLKCTRTQKDATLYKDAVSHRLSYTFV